MVSIAPEIMDFVSGKLTYGQFGQLFDTKPEIWENAQSLLPERFQETNGSMFTKKTQQILIANNFSVKSAALAFGYETNYAQRLVYDLLSDLVAYWRPDIQRRLPPAQSFPDLLEKLNMDYLGGPEIEDVLDNAILSVSEDQPKKEYEKLVKKTLRDTFHLVPRKMPKWAQEPEWPMGTRSPMVFLFQKQDGDLVRYHFRDVDTEATRIIEQYY